MKARLNEISREEFVKECTTAIIKTRNEITIKNQISGFRKYETEINNHYLSRARGYKEKYERTIHCYSLFYRHEFAKHTKLGNCQELADYLAYEILVALKARNINARVRVMKSNKVDHVYLHIRIQLEGEKKSSLWEVDAWDPRIIDVSKGVDGKRKNENLLRYGLSPILHYSTSTDEFVADSNKVPPCSFTFPPPKEEQNPSKISKYELYRKHRNLYKDYTLSSAFEKKELDPDGVLHGPQRRSSWQ